VNTVKKRTWSASTLALPAVICVLAAVLVASGCSAASTSVDPTQDRKAMMETAANWYVALGAQDLNGKKAAVYDPGNILGYATATPAPASAPRTAIAWRWDGDNIVMSSPSKDSTVTITNSAATPNNVELYSAGGTGGTLVMTKIDGKWKIDAAATQKASDAAAAKESKPQTVSPAPGKGP
jgi:hypothetical protein